MRTSRHLVSLRTFGLAFAVALSPALMQGSGSGCASGDTTLSTFEIEVLGQNHIVFDPAQRVYWVWLPSIADTAIVRAYSTDPNAELTWVYQDAAEEVVDAGWFSSFVGGGEMTLDGSLLPGRSYLRVYVKYPGQSAGKNYTALIQVGCSDCDDGNACTQDACDPTLDACAHPLESGCPPTGNALLSSFELEVFGQNQIDFDTGQQDYWAWLPAIADTAIVRAYSVDASAEVTYEYRGAVGELLELRSFIRGGEVTLDGLVPPEQSVLRVWVKDPDGALRIYTVVMYVGCVDCDDGNECTSDACDPTLEMCVHPPEPGGTACNAGGIPGICVGATCRAFCSATNCSDGNPCTVDSCDPVLAVCEHTVLADGSACGAGVCYAGNCSCAQGCDDGNECTIDACDVPADQCVHTPVADGTLCSGDLGTCHAGNCACAQDCDDGNECTDDACDPAVDQCEHTPVADGTLCSGDLGICHSGGCACAQGCDDGNACTDDACNHVADQCEHTPLADGTACPGAGSCEAVSCVGGTFACTEQGIRDAIAAGGGPHTFDCAAPTTVVTAAAIVIDANVILDGEGILTVDGNDSHGVFVVAPGVTTEMRGFVVTRGNALLGGGIYNGGTLVLADSTVTNNAAPDRECVEESCYICCRMFCGTCCDCLMWSGYGGGIYNTGSLTITNTTISSNSAFTYSGGGIYSSGTLTIASSAVSGNSPSGIHNTGSLDMSTSTVSLNSGGGNCDAAISNQGTATIADSAVWYNISPCAVINNGGTLTMTRSAVSDNEGGGIYNPEDGILTLVDGVVSGNQGLDGGIVNVGDLTLVNSTVSGNAAFTPTPFVGGIYNRTVSSTLQASLILLNSTIADNAGGDIYNDGATLIAKNSIVDTPYGCLGPTVPAFVSDGYNIESYGDTCGFDQATDVVDVYALNLGPLADNGGPTMTHALLPGSVAIDRIPDTACVGSDGAPLAKDQRGVTRPQGTACDVGAFELEQ